MRKKDKIKGVMPYLVGGVNLWVIHWIIKVINTPLTSDTQVIVVLLWAGMTVLGVMRMDKIIDMWDKDDREEG